MRSSRPGIFYLHNITDKEALFEWIAFLRYLFYGNFFWKHNIDPILRHSGGRLSKIFYILIM